MRRLAMIQRCINQLFILCALTIRPFLGPAQCRFYETCTRYIVRQFKEQATHRALINSIKRLLACSPLHTTVQKKLNSD